MSKKNLYKVLLIEEKKLIETLHAVRGVMKFHKPITQTINLTEKQKSELISFYKLELKQLKERGNDLLGLLQKLETVKSDLPATLKKEKRCPSCEVFKSLDNFSKDKNKKDGLNVYCRICRDGFMTEWRTKNPEKHAANSLRWAKKNRISKEDFKAKEVWDKLRDFPMSKNR